MKIPATAKLRDDPPSVQRAANAKTRGPKKSGAPPGRTGFPAAFAFTLVETITTLAILSVLLLAIGSTLVIASHAIPDHEAPNVRSIRAADVADQLAADLETALTIENPPASTSGAPPSARQLTMIVPDRDGDGIPERIDYDWSGTAGDPLTRSTNGKHPAILINDIERFEIEYEIDRTEQTYAGLAVEAASETLLSSFVPGSVDSENRDGDLAGQHLVANLPGDAEAYRVTAFEALVYRGLLSVSLPTCELRLARADGQPSTDLLSETTNLDLGVASGTGWFRVEFDSPPAPASRDLTVLFGSSLSKYWDPAAAGRLDSVNGSWRYDAGKSLIYRLYGHAWRPGPDKTLTHRFINRMSFTLDPGGDSAPIRSTASLLTRPEILKSHWRAEFQADPTSLDRDSDGQSDFARRSGQSFDPGALVEGLWEAGSNVQLVTRPAHGFTRPTVIESRMRAEQTGGPGPRLWIDAEYRQSDSRGAPIWAQLIRQGEGTQTLQLYNQTSGSSSEGRLLQEVRGLPGGLINVRLTIDPADNSVNLQANGVDHGTFGYQRFVHNDSTRFASAFNVDAAAAFDRFEVRVLADGQ